MKKGLFMKTMWLIVALFFCLHLPACSKTKTITQGAASNNQPAAESSVEAGIGKMAVRPAISSVGHVSFDDIRFDFDCHQLKPPSREVMGKIASYLASAPSATVLVEGHCDERGSAEYNYALGQRRADSAKRFLLDSGIDTRRISTVSYGKDRPLYTAGNEEAWA